MTFEEAMVICDLIPSSTYDQGDESIVNALRANFPLFKWRTILDRSSPYTRWALTVDDNDVREHYVKRSTDPLRVNFCVHCTKTAKELGIEERDDD